MHPNDPPWGWALKLFLIMQACQESHWSRQGAEFYPGARGGKKGEMRHVVHGLRGPHAIFKNIYRAENQQIDVTESSAKAKNLLETPDKTMGKRGLGPSDFSLGLPSVQGSLGLCTHKRRTPLGHGSHCLEPP